jgi:hypothetical protein
VTSVFSVATFPLGVLLERYDNCSQAIVIDCGRDGLAIRPTWLISLASILSLVCFVASRIILMCEVAALSLNAAR